MTNFRIMEDPRISHVAKICHDEMMAEVVRRWIAGADFFHARESVMAERGNDIARTYGKDVATRALAALVSGEPGHIPQRFHAERYSVMMDRGLWSFDYSRGGIHHWSPLQKWGQENRHLIDGLLTVSMQMIISSPFFGAVISAISGFDFSLWIPATIWTAGLGLSILAVWALMPLLVGGSPKQRRGTAPKTNADLLAQQKLMDDINYSEHMDALQKQSEAERSASEKDRSDREYAASLRRMANEMERQDRPKRLYVPKVRSSQRKMH